MNVDKILILQTDNLIKYFVFFGSSHHRFAIRTYLNDQLEGLCQNEPSGGKFLAKKMQYESLKE